MREVEFEGLKIRWLGHAAFRLEAMGTTVYVDPYQIRESPRDGDIVVCTHDHYDHCSIGDIRRVIKEDGVIVAASNCSAKLARLRNEKIFLRPGDRVEVKGVVVRAVPAYNIAKPFHPRSYEGIGVVVELGGVRVYHAGDTDLIPEMNDLRGNVDVALLPVSGVYVMDAREAVEAAKRIGPRLAIPMHYGSIVGSERDARAFENGLRGVCRVEIL